METMEELLSQILLMCVPVLLYFFIGWYARKRRGEITSSYSSRQETQIAGFLKEYFSLSDGSMAWTFSEGGREFRVTLDPDSADVQGIDDVRIRINGLDLGTLREYVNADAHFSHEVMRFLIHHSSKRMRKRFLAPLREHPEGVQVQTLMKEISDANTTVDDADVHGAAERILRDLRFLRLDHPESIGTQKIFTRYLPLYREILESYGKLEEAGSRGQKQAYHEQVLKISALLEEALETIGKQADQEGLDDAWAKANGLAAVLQRDAEQKKGFRKHD